MYDRWYFTQFRDDLAKVAEYTWEINYTAYYRGLISEIGHR